MNELTPFVFEDLEQPLDAELKELSNTERQALRALAEPAGPLWKIVRQLVEFQSGLAASLLNSNLHDEKQLSAARQVQAQMQAVQFVVERIAAALTLVKDEEGEEDE